MLTQQEALDLFKYEDGYLYRKTGGAGFRKGIVNNVRVGGYSYVRIKGKKYPTHRVIFLMHHGFLPEQVDHIDTNRQNNKIENLRAATNAQNCRNRRRKITNSSGVKNVSWHKPLKKWRIQICVDARIKHIGYFEDLEIANLIASEHRDFYHGEFANHE